MKYNQQNNLEFGGSIYHINMAFPLVLEFFKFMKDDKMTALEKVDLALFSFVKDDVSELPDMMRSQLLDKIYSTYIFTEEDQQKASLMQSEKKSFDYEIDSELIYSAFLQQYHIDLTDPAVNETLTWKQFNALLDGLSEDTFFRKVTLYRTTKISEDMSDDAKEYIKKMQLMYSLNRHKVGEKLTADEIKMILAPLDRIQKIKKLKELGEQGKLPERR